jgi:hypothetical protein
MGRPVNARYFGSGSGNQIKVKFKTGGTEYDGYIVKQLGSKKFKVSDGTRTITGFLVNKSAGGLANGDIIINVLTDAGVFEQATKLYNRVAIIEGTRKQKWNFATSSSDGAVRIQDVEGTTLRFITVSQGLVDTLLDLSDDADDAVAFSVTAAATGGSTITYAWAYSDDAGATWSTISGATSSSYTTDALILGNSGRKYRVTMTAAGADPVESIATVTVQA